VTTIQATIQTPPKDDFTVFKDPTIALKMARSINSQLPRSPTTQSPIPKRGKMNELDDVGQTAESKNGFFGKENVSSLLQLISTYNLNILLQTGH
jgi:hypothetical protein